VTPLEKKKTGRQKIGTEIEGKQTFPDRISVFLFKFLSTQLFHKLEQDADGLQTISGRKFCIKRCGLPPHSESLFKNIAKSI
jgi:hypothetical protein